MTRNMNDTHTFSIKTLTKGTLPRVPFSEIKKAVLGAKYELSLVVSPPARMRALNKQYRGKDAPTDILAFPLSPKGGEIFLCPADARSEAKKFGRPYENFLAFLFIHGCVHLKGYEHGSRMEAQEKKFRRKFNI